MLVNPKSSNAIENTMNKILALKEDTAANIILAFIILIVIFVTIYLLIYGFFSSLDVLQQYIYGVCRSYKKQIVQQ